jgi:hypothetical protein
MAAEQFANIVDRINMIKNIVNVGIQNYKFVDSKFLNTEFESTKSTFIYYCKSMIRNLITCSIHMDLQFNIEDVEIRYRIPPI